MMPGICKSKISLVVGKTARCVMNYEIVYNLWLILFLFINCFYSYMHLCAYVWVFIKLILKYCL